MGDGLIRLSAEGAAFSTGTRLDLEYTHTHTGYNISEGVHTHNQLMAFNTCHVSFAF